jgi:hypothetical protein
MSSSFCLAIANAQVFESQMRGLLAGKAAWKV